jgi:SAM-dependent methyltransferase
VRPELDRGLDGVVAFDAAAVIDVLEAVPPDGLIEILRWLQERLALGAPIAVRVSTGLIGPRPGSGPRFCAATYMAAFRRAGFRFGRLRRVLLDARAPDLIAARRSMPFHDPLELRTSGLEAILFRPDRVKLAEVALAGERTALHDDPLGDFSAARRKWPRQSDKRSAAWGQKRAKSLWDGLYAPWIEDADGRSFLDVGCSWGYLFKYMLDRCSPRKLIGIDIAVHWEKAPFAWQSETRAAVELHREDIFSVPLPEASFDYILCTGVLMLLPPSMFFATIQKMRRLLRPGGELLLRTQTFTSHLGLQMHRAFELPYVHLFHDEKLLRERLERAGRRQPPYSSWFTATTYVSAFADAGFEIREVRRQPNSYSPEVQRLIFAEFPASYEEMGVDQLAARLVRPETDA